MLMCPKCRFPVRVNLSSFYGIYGVPVIAKKGLEVSELYLDGGEFKQVNQAEFFCPNCNESVAREDLVLSCTSCAEILPAGELTRIEGFPGIYCEKHREAVKEAYPKDDGSSFKENKVSDYLCTFTFVPKGASR